MLFGGGMAAVLLLAFQAIQREQSEAHRPSLDAPFVASLEPVVERMLALAEVGPTDHVVDLGCGDGRIVVAAARDRGATGLGVDLDPARIREAEAAARSAGVDTRVRFRVQNLFETGIADADVVALYLLPELNLRLRPRLLAELRPGARIVSHAFDMGDWPPDRSSDAEGAKVYVWVVPAPVAGRWTLTDPAGRRAEVALDQRFQTLSGTASAGGQRGPLRNPRLSGDRVRFTANLGSGPQTFEGQWSQGSIALSGGWRMERAG
jgi:SAM-dependent methyltransferase